MFIDQIFLQISKIYEIVSYSLIPEMLSFLTSGKQSPGFPPLLLAVPSSESSLKVPLHYLAPQPTCLAPQPTSLSIYTFTTGELIQVPGIQIFPSPDSYI